MESNKNSIIHVINCITSSVIHSNSYIASANINLDYTSRKTNAQLSLINDNTNENYQPKGNYISSENPIISGTLNVGSILKTKDSTVISDQNVITLNYNVNDTYVININKTLTNGLIFHTPLNLQNNAQIKIRLNLNKDNDVKYYSTDEVLSQSLFHVPGIYDLSFKQLGNEISFTYNLVGAIPETQEDYLKFEADQNNSTIQLVTDDEPDRIRINYFDSVTKTWHQFINGQDQSVIVTLANIGDYIFLKGQTNTFNCGSDKYQFRMTGKIKASGNIMSLVNFQEELIDGRIFRRLFEGCSSLITAPKLPAIILFGSCYDGMFYNCTNLISAPELPATSLPEQCYMGMFQNCTSLVNSPDLPATILEWDCYSHMFAGCTSLVNAPELPATALFGACYSNMFNGCASLINIPALPATTLAEGCYGGMFRDCIKLVSAPALPATTLAEGCYGGMFAGCTSLVNAPILPATNLQCECYAYMFQRCTNLNYVSANFTAWNDDDEPTTDWLAGVASEGNFNCPASLPQVRDESHIPTNWRLNGQKIPQKLRFINKSSSNVLSVVLQNVFDTDTQIKYSANGTIWATYTKDLVLEIYPKQYIMFKNQSNIFKNKHFKFSGLAIFEIEGNLQSMWNFQTSNLSNNVSISGLFSNNMTLTKCSLGLLENIQLFNNCYQSLFQGCIGLKNAPKLLATTLANNCYYGMFKNCENLIKSPELPANTLTSGCYKSMFKGCTRLKTVPQLSATTLANECYRYMFQDCKQITDSPILSATTLVNNCYNHMFYGCSNLSFITVAFTSWNDAQNATTDWVYGVATNGKFEAPNNLQQIRNSSHIPAQWKFGISEELTFIALQNNSSVRLLSYDDYQQLEELDLWYRKNYGSWTKLTNYSDIITLNKDQIVSYWNKTASFSKSDNSYYYFSIEGSLDVEGNIMSLINYSEQLTEESQFYQLFAGCSSLHSAQNLQLPATTLTVYCYQNMFNNCTSLVSAPELLASSLTPYCYGSMFANCTSLVNAPELPATNLAQNCYDGMFQNCTSLVTAPELPATTLQYECYAYMFYGCISLTGAPELPAAKLQYYCYKSMFEGCINLINCGWIQGHLLAESCCQCMFKNCASLKSEFYLGASNLVTNCYMEMFYGCTNLSFISVDFSDWNQQDVTDATTNWVYGVNSNSSSRFQCWQGLDETRGPNNIPDGWTITYKD